MKIELHCHTRVSDGSFTFDEVLEQAVQNQVSHLAITNHDTTQELGSMFDKGLKRGVTIIPGIEISAFDFERKRRVHIIGYDIEPGHPALEQLCSPMLKLRHEGCLSAVDKLVKAGYAITLEQVLKHAEGGTGIYKQHIMHALIDAGYTTSYYGDLYQKLFARGTNGEQPGLAHTPMKYVDGGDAIRAIIAAGGVPVLAHPGQYRSFEYVPILVEAGLQGIEVWHPLHGEAEETQAQEIAKTYNLVMTGGSDFHGIYGEKEVQLGSKSPDLATIQLLLARKPAI